ncbi:MAG: malto-oligosyltrehalose trehalohydrolase [Thermoprotei archaeon]
MWSPDFCPNPAEGGWSFNVWAPKCSSLSLVTHTPEGRKIFPLERGERGWFHVWVEGLSAGSEYGYLCGTKELPDPASRFQPHGVHGPSMLVDPQFEWSDWAWKGLGREQLVVYELHVGTFSPQGTFDAVMEKLGYLRDLGVTAIEIMPVAQFPGPRNWGYDGVLLYSVQNSYGGPWGLKRLVNKAHMEGLGVILDVVYNHIGPEGNYLDFFAPFFSSKYTTPWGKSFNLDDAGCDEVRKYIIQNALYWIREYHVDGLRLDAVHAIFDSSPKHIVQEICEKVKRTQDEVGKKLVVIAESDLNDPKVVYPKERCGWGADAQWCDDFHHSIHAYLTGEREGYYADFGGIDQVAKAFTKAFVYDGIYSSYRGRTHGAPVSGLDGCSFIVYSQNHDQVGNRRDAKRLLSLVGELKAKMAASMVILSPFTPMLFMGEEYGETNPFYFFSSFGDEKVAEATSSGKKREMGEYYVDPQSLQAFERSKLDWCKADSEVGRRFLAFYRELIRIRKVYDLGCARNVEFKASNKHIHIVRGKLNLLLVFEDCGVECGSWELVLCEGDFPKKLTAGYHVLGKGIAIYVEQKNTEPTRS